jgi:hypothetical protein
MMPCWSCDLTAIRPICQLYPVNFVYMVDEWQMSVGQVITYYAYLAVMSAVASFGVMRCLPSERSGGWGVCTIVPDESYQAGSICRECRLHGACLCAPVTCPWASTPPSAVSAEKK